MSGENGEELRELCLTELLVPRGQPKLLARRAVGGRLIAYMHYREYAGDVWAVNDLFVDSKRRGEGLASSMVEEVLTMAQGSQAVVYLFVASNGQPNTLDNKQLRAFYERHGFEQHWWEEPVMVHWGKGTTK